MARVVVAVLLLLAVFYIFVRCLDVPTHTLSLEDAIANGKTGDLVLFQWYYVDVAHKLVSRYSHVGMFVRDPSSGRLFIAEAHNVSDTRHHGIYSGGVHLYPAKERLQKYTGNTYLQPLNQPLAWSLQSKILKRLTTHYNKMPFYQKYRKHYLFNCLMNRALGVVEKQYGSHFCSEFVAVLFKDAGLLAAEEDTQCYTPESVSKMPLVNGYHFLPPLRIVA